MKGPESRDREAALSSATPAAAGEGRLLRLANLPRCARLGVHRLAQVAWCRSPRRAEGSWGTLCSQLKPALVPPTF